MSRSPLRSIWLNPSQTIARIAHENPGYRLYPGYSMGRAILNSIVVWVVAAVLFVVGAVALGSSGSMTWLFLAGTEELVTLSGL